MVKKAPVDAVGGTQDQGPWPESIDEIVAGEQYDRLVKLDDGSTTTVPVTVTEVRQIRLPDGTPTDGYTVTIQYDDPTTDGGGTL